MTALLLMTYFSTDGDRLDKAHAASLTAPHPRTPTWYTLAGKRTLDLILVIATAVIAVPVVCVLAIAIMITGQAPFYVQRRIGRNGKSFRMWKLQTMLPNADQRLETYLASNPEARAEWDSKQKLMNDPRITPLGNFLRKTSLDELPQLFNVANGTMSLVGPRPMMLDQKDHYTGNAYFRLRPGMTGLWQVSDRNSSDFIDRVRFDEAYNRMVSLRTDIGVLFQTVAVVLRGTGV